MDFSRGVMAPISLLPLGHRQGQFHVGRRRTYFFKNRLPGLSLGMETLTPLTAFVAKRQGSVVLARGRVTAFEIIG